jgi:hypothetical protein
MTVPSLAIAPELATADDPPVDFCLWAYDPPAPMRRGDLRGVNLLYAAAELRGCQDAYRRAASALRAELGAFRTVWGVKKNGATLSSEFYFYDYERLERAASFARIAAAFAPVAEVAVEVDQAIPYFMTSIELPMAPGALPARIEAADIYIGNPGSGVSSGICYEVGQGGRTELKNFYFFFDAQADWDSVVAKAGCSAHVPFGALEPDELFPDWLRAARVAVIANKRYHDSVYFSGVGIDALIRFLRRFEYPQALADYAEANRAAFGHLQFDVGFDYRVEGGRLITAKSSFYNVL